VKLLRMLAGMMLLFLLAIPTFAQNSPVGLWRNVEGAKSTFIRIAENGGKLTGRIEKVQNGSLEDRDAKCSKCKDDKKDKPMAGLELIWDVVKSGDKWDGGKLLDPDSGRIVNCRLEMSEGGKKLLVRGSIAFLSKTQTWSREE
jgi:uncharacterized protein (DUF2147 family)